MSTLATLVASIAVTANMGTVVPAVTMQKHDFTQGMQPIRDCRKYEAAYHSGNDNITKHGMKTTSYRVSEKGIRYEVTTFCVEEN